MSRIVALDVGDARIGIAATDELKIIAAPVKTLSRSASVKADVRMVAELVTQLQGEAVIVGQPLDAEGQESPQSMKTEEFLHRLSARLRVPVFKWDERYSTAEAERMLVDRGVSRKKRRETIDQWAAVVILQSYLESRERT